ncbi:hypothetical protein IW146_008825 [Coemansia sp. RSA 922]|nr:hypothetical protein H4S04_002308 [Coemansia sp. S16]KAJ2103651.1 hypothetical protein IW146_008825 [Coemansia sp. RSA 922]
MDNPARDRGKQPNVPAACQSEAENGKGKYVTSERLLVVLGEAPYVSLGYIHEAYRYIYGCELMSHTIPSHECIKMLTKVVAVEHWAPRLEGEDSEYISRLNILCRRDLELAALRQSYLEQLGLAVNLNVVVLGPRLCYVVVRMCSMSVDLLTGTIISSMFLDVTGLDLHSLNVVTEQDVRQMETSSICHMVKSWVGSLGKFITEDFSTDDAHYAAKLCNAAYATKCGSASSDHTSVALSMLSNNEHDSELFLGNREAKWEALCRCLILVTGKNTSSYAKEFLVQLSKSLQIQPSSS